MILVIEFHSIHGLNSVIIKLIFFLSFFLYLSLIHVCLFLYSSTTKCSSCFLEIYYNIIDPPGMICTRRKLLLETATTDSNQIVIIIRRRPPTPTPTPHSFIPIRNFWSPVGRPITPLDEEEPQRKHFVAKHTISKKLVKSHRRRTVLLNHQFVQSKLLNCTSDLISLCFFLWCARQPGFFHHQDALAHMVIVLARLTQRFGTVGEITKQLQSVGFVTEPLTLLLILRIYWRGQMYDMVFEAFEEMFNHGYSPDTYARNVVMDVLFKIGRPTVALRVLKETQVPNLLSLSIAVCNLCRLNDLISVKDVLRTMFVRGIFLNVEHFHKVLSCFCKSSRQTEALQLLGIMITLGVPISVNVWSILIAGFCKSGRLDMAVCLLEKMMEAGCSPNVVTYTPLVKGLMESGLPSRAFDILSTMESRGCSPDLVLCNVLIDSLSKMGRYDDALDVFFSLTKWNLTPDSYTFSSIVSAICLSRQFALLPIIASGLVVQSDLVACNSLLFYFCKADYPTGVVEFYTDMIDRGFVPDRYTYCELLRALCRARRTDEAVNVYHGILNNHFDIDARIPFVVIDGLLKSGNLHTGIRLFMEAAAKNYPLDVVSYSVVLNGLFRGGRSAEAYALYTKMKDGGVALNAKTYNVILSGFCRERNIKMVEQILGEMIDARIELDCKRLNNIKSMLLKSQHSHGLFNLFVESWELGLMPDEAIYELGKGLSHGVNLSDARFSQRYC